MQTHSAKIGRRQFMTRGGLLAIGATSAASPVLGTNHLRVFIDKFYEAWRRAEPDAVLAYFADDAVVTLCGSGSTLVGKALIASDWVVPTLKRSPGAIHEIKDAVETPERIWIEWLYKAPDTTTGDRIALPGCSLYVVGDELIRSGHLYFNPALARQPAKS